MVHVARQYLSSSKLTVKCSVRCIRFTTVHSYNYILFDHNRVFQMQKNKNKFKLECGPMPNVMVALPNIGGTSVQRRKVWRPLLECRAVTLPRCETRWNLQGCPKLPDRSQPLVGLSLPYCANMWRRYSCFKSFFPIVDTCLSCEDIAGQSCAMVHRWQFFASCIFSEPRSARFRLAS